MTDPAVRRSPIQRGVVVGIAVASALVLGACSSSTADGEQPVPDYDPAPQPVNTAAPAAQSEDVGDLRLPFQLEENPVVDPQWQTAPQHADGVFLAAGDTGGILTYRAVDSSGTVRWEADRPLSCTGFTLTRAEGRPLAVLTDITASDDSFGTTTASAYDLHTGETVWGPVDVPGPHQGPGTVFAAPPQAQMGELGPKKVLDPATGAVLADERGNRENNDVQIVGEYGGTVLLVQQDQLQAHAADALHGSTEESEPVWTLDAAELGGNTTDAAEVVSPDAGSTAPLTAALVGTSSDDLALIDLETGGIIADGLRDAAQGPSSRTWVTLGDQLAGYDASGAQLYAEPAASLEFAGIGAAMAYLRTDDGDIQPHNVVTGEIGRAYDPAGTGTIAVPSYISPSGTGVLETDDGFLLAPVD